MGFINLKLHTDYSLLEGVGSIDEYVNKATQYNQSVLGITDTSLFGAMKFYYKCKEHNIKPIIGLEIYVKGFLEEQYYYSLTVIAKDNEGLKEISQLSTKSYENEIKGNIFVNIEDIKNLKNVYILSGGLNSEYIKYILENKFEEANKVLNLLIESIPNIYFEVPLFDLTDKQREEIYLSYDNTKINPVLTNDVYYVNKEDKILQKIFSAIRTNRTLKSVIEDIKVEGIYFKNIEKIEFYPDILVKEAIKNIDNIVSNCNIEILEDRLEFPSVDIPENLNEREYIETLLYKGIKEKYKENEKEAIERLNYELDIIEKMGYIKYFLIVHDFVKYAKNNNIYVGPGRGSAAGSIISYLLDITEVDPIKYGLLFERFLNPQRISMPDIDVDIEQEKRPDLIEYIRNKYTYKNFSQIVTFATYQPKLALRDIAKVMEIPEKSIKFLLERAKDGLENLTDDREMIKDLIRYARRIENKNKNISTHAAGVIISHNDMSKNLPLTFNSYDNTYQSQYEAYYLEKLGYLKMDILGLRFLNIVKSTLERVGVNLDIYNLPEDRRVFSSFDRGENLGIFQCESVGITKIASRLKISSIEDISLLLALYRPGPLKGGYVDKLINIKNSGNKIEYLHPILEDILKPTYGVIIYQEQIMQIASKVSNYTLAEADELRKAISKKNIEVLEKNREIFIQKAIIPKDKAKKIYDLIENFGDYGFNKSHSISYAYITYLTVYLKYHYPLEFYASVLDSELKDENKLLSAYSELSRKNIKILKPDINISREIYEIVDGNLILPLSAIKDMSIKSAKDVLQERDKNGTFIDFYDFCRRCRFLTKSNIEGLIYSGAFDSFGINKNTLISNLSSTISWIDKKIKAEEDIVSSLFYKTKLEIPDYNMVPYEEYSHKELIKKEKEYIKINLTQLTYIEENIINKLLVKEKNMILGIPIEVVNRPTVNKELMANITIFNDNGEKRYPIFPKQFLEYIHNLNIDKLNIFIISPTQKDYCISKIFNIDDYSKFKLLVKLDEDNSDKFKKILLNNKGNNDVGVYLNKDGKIEKYDIKNRIKLDEEVLNIIVNELGIENVKLKFIDLK